MEKNSTNPKNTSLQPNKNQKVVRGNPSQEHKQIALPASTHVQAKAGYKKKKMHFSIIVCILLLLFILLAGGVMATQYMFGDLTIETLDHEMLGINANIAQTSQEQGIKNIALFGVDSRSGSIIDGRSDSIMVISIDQKNGSVKMTSILRDSLVYIDGFGEDKITHAYAYGGASLAIKTINEAFALDIQDYVAINFQGFANVVDAMGGVEIEITNAERKQINIYANRDGLSAPYIESAGLVTLDGAQATAYSRIRKIDGDDQRANRQQKVLTELMSSMKTMPKSQYPSMVKTVMGYTETSLSLDQILAFSPMLLGDISLEGDMVPSEEKDDPIGGNYNGQWVWQYDLDPASKRIHEFIYDTENFTEQEIAQ